MWLNETQLWQRLKTEKRSIVISSIDHTFHTLCTQRCSLESTYERFSARWKEGCHLGSCRVTWRREAKKGKSRVGKAGIKAKRRDLCLTRVGLHASKLPIDHAHSHIIFNHSISRLNAPASSQRTQRLFVIGLHFFLLRFYVHPSPFLSPWRCHGWIQTPVSLIDSFFLFVSYRGKCFRSIDSPPCTLQYSLHWTHSFR